METVQPKKSLRSTRHLITFFSDAEYYRQLWRIALPITLQQLIMSSLNMVAVMIIGQLGETSLAAVGLANQVGFLSNLVLFGITSGAAIFTAQFWGKQDVVNIRKMLGICLTLGLGAAVLFLGVAILFPELVLGIYSTDQAVVVLGSQYLRIYGWTYLFLAISSSYGAILRSIGDVRTPLVVSLVALSLNILLSYILIFGRLGLPAMGVLGAAWASLLSRVLECTGLLAIVYMRRGPTAARLGEMFSYDWRFVGKVMNRVLPVTLNELLWALGIAMYNVVYARLGTGAIAAINMASTIDNMAFVVAIGIGNACAILVGNLIGAGEHEKAFRYAGRSLGLAIVAGWLVGGVVFLVSPAVLSTYKVSPEVLQSSQRVALFIALFLWLRSSNYLLFIGIIRAGGDTRFGFFLDVGSIWIVGVPMAFVGAFVLHLPVYLVYLMITLDEATKFAIGLWRFFSRRWINDVTKIAESVEI